MIGGGVSDDPSPNSEPDLRPFGWAEQSTFCPFFSALPVARKALNAIHRRSSIIAIGSDILNRSAIDALAILSPGVITCAAFDIRELRVPNILSIPPFFVAVSYAFVCGGDCLVLFLIVFGVFIVAWYLSALGGADVKVISTIGAFWGMGLFFVLLVWVIWAAITRLKYRKSKPFPVMAPIALGTIIAGVRCL